MWPFLCIFLVVTNLANYKTEARVPTTCYILTDSAIAFRPFLIMIRTLYGLQPYNLLNYLHHHGMDIGLLGVYSLI